MTAVVGNNCQTFIIGAMAHTGFFWWGLKPFPYTHSLLFTSPLSYLFRAQFTSRMGVARRGLPVCATALDKLMYIANALLLTHSLNFRCKFSCVILVDISLICYVNYVFCVCDDR